MSPLLILSLTLFIQITHGETLETTMTPNTTPITCNLTSCNSYTSSNSSWLLSSGSGCQDNVNGINICTTCSDGNNECKCVECVVGRRIGKIVADAVSGIFGTLLEVIKIIVFIVGGVFGLCIIIGCTIYFAFGGAVLFIAVTECRNSRETTGQTQMV